MPQFTGGAQSQIPTTDNASIINQDYQNRLAAWQQQQASLGGLFSGVGSMFAAFSDRRVKEDVEKVGKTDDGQPIYAFRYKGGGPMQLGLMAQDVEKKKPEAVMEGPGGIKMVDYKKALSLGAK